MEANRRVARPSRPSRPPRVASLQRSVVSAFFAAQLASLCAAGEPPAFESPAAFPRLPAYGLSPKLPSASASPPPAASALSPLDPSAPLPSAAPSAAQVPGLRDRAAPAPVGVDLVRRETRVAEASASPTWFARASAELAEPHSARRTPKQDREEDDGESLGGPTL
ncbi:putative phosphate transporter family protein [Besnoitia besnoiti]|uniref:Putative phosphate transporter family protein n=1 Tax=Besnoitia besnoiti TaxID=94643 RepID=A0A2A9MBQ9_BESBE|nr:putative phosphate transporter family protein [Besnoitia besnoiti]PFH33346.1 putative phosphate transporter family protein [Besnoitia besnoiti]